MDSKDSFPIVGIGASAGGLSAFEAFFTALDPANQLDTSFIIVQHLSPTYKSMLSDIIQHYTEMDVIEVTDGVIVAPNTTYIIPPNKSMTYSDGLLHLFPYKSNPSDELPIDFFFHSIAESLREKAICMIFSGTGADGTKGLRAVSEVGGITVVQDPITTEHTGMPQSALDTGLIDYKLSPSDIGKNMGTIIAHKNTASTSPSNIIETESEDTLNKLFFLIRKQVGHDFSNYKRNTIDRRLSRRMNIHHVVNLKDYVNYLEHSPEEVEELYKDLLIGVTSFFRDPVAFKKLEDEIIPLLLEDKPSESTIRIWCAGCSTGEEAYSLAILFFECAKKLNRHYNLQIFATDIDLKALAFARGGCYSSDIRLVMTEEKLNQYFISEDHGTSYRINKTIRDMLIFSEQSIIKDPPFSRIDFLSCRNLMIYMNSRLQKQIIPTFNYALLPKGILFLGSSESIGENEAFLKTLDRELKIYQKKSDYYQSRAFIPRVNYSASSMNRLPYSSVASRVLTKKPPLRQLMEQIILKECKMVGALVDEKGDILYLHGRLGMYLEVSPGEASVNNILSMAKEGLKRELTVSLHKAVKTRETVSSDDIDIKIDGRFKKISFEIKHVKTPEEDLPPLFALLIVDDSKDLLKPVKLDNKKISTSELKLEMEELKTELRIKQAYIDTTNETFETTNEELQASNEELQSFNEELQSTNEELETSKEELQSINEELITVNNELQVKVHELSCANNDMNNLLSGTNIATIFIDFGLKLTRFTPTATKLINLIPSDVGRPIADIVSNIVNYDQLVSDINSVLDTLIPKEIQIETNNNKWYTMKIQPYRTIDNIIEGAVITFVDITEIKRLNDVLTISELRYRKMFETTLQGIVFIDALSGKIIDVNPRFVEMFGMSETQLMGRYPWQVDLFKDIVTSSKDLAHLQNNDYVKYNDLLMDSGMGKKISIELISNAIVSDKHKLIQWNFRSINADN